MNHEEDCMSRRSFPLVVLVLTMGVPLASHAAGSEMERAVRFDPPAIEALGEYDRLSLPGCAAVGAPGEPRLPSRLVYVLVPYGQEVVQVEVETPGRIDLPGFFTLRPAGRPVPLLPVRLYPVDYSPLRGQAA
jgi:hypothetical protein